MDTVIALSKGWEYECPKCGCEHEIDDISTRYPTKVTCDECEFIFWIVAG